MTFNLYIYFDHYYTNLCKHSLFTRSCNTYLRITIYIFLILNFLYVCQTVCYYQRINLNKKCWSILWITKYRTPLLPNVVVKSFYIFYNLYDVSVFQLTSIAIVDILYCTDSHISCLGFSNTIYQYRTVLSVYLYACISLHAIQNNITWTTYHLNI